MPVKYSGPDGQKSIIPAPYVSVDKQYQFDSNGIALSPEYSIRLTGTLIGNKDTIDASASTSRDFGMHRLAAQHSGLRRLFSGQSGLLVVEAPNFPGSGFQTYCNVLNVSIEDGPWVDQSRYTVTLQASRMSGEVENTERLRSRSESLSVDENPNGTYILTHDLAAVGATIIGSGGVEDTSADAKAWCRAKSYLIDTSGGITSTSGYGLNNFISDISPGNNWWNYSVREGIGVTENSWRLSENFIYYSGGNAREEWTSSFNESADDPAAGTVSVQGTVFGYASGNNDYTVKFTNASGYWTNTVSNALYSRASEFVPSYMSLYPYPYVKAVTNNKIGGEVNYNYTFKTTASTLISGAISEDISIADTGPLDIFAQIPIPGRAYGPVIQNMSTVSLPSRTVTIEATMSGVQGSVTQTPASLLSLYLSKPDTSGILDALKPNNGYYYTTQNQENWNPIKRRYNRSITWTIQREGALVSGVPSGISNTA